MEALFQYLRTITRVIDNHGIDYWLDAGTLLKTVRAGGVLQKSSDVDLGLRQEDLSKIQDVLAELEGLGYRIYPQSGFFMVEDLFKIYFREGECDGADHIDFYLYSQQGEELVRRSPHKAAQHHTFSKYWMILMNKYTFNLILGIKKNRIPMLPDRSLDIRL